MPIYEYECLSKGHRFEVVQKITENPLKKCQVCGSKVRQLISAPSFSLKGGGWYKDGYASVKPTVGSDTSPKKETSKEVSTVKKETKPKTKE